MNKNDLQKLYTQHMRKSDNDPSGEIIQLEQVTRLVWHSDKVGVVLHSDLTEATADDALTQEIDYFNSRGYGFEWKYFSYDQPDDLQKRLLAHGFSEDEREAVLVLDIQDTPEQLLDKITYDIQLATTDQHFADMDQVYYEVWKDNLFTDASETRMSDWLLPRVRNHPGSLSVYVVYVDDRPVSYGRVEYAEGNPFASIWGGSTIEAYRRRGIYTQLVAKRLQKALEIGCDYLTVDARFNTSKPILEKLGFIHIADAIAYNWQAKTLTP